MYQGPGKQVVNCQDPGFYKGSGTRKAQLGNP